MERSWPVTLFYCTLRLNQGLKLCLHIEDYEFVPRKIGNPRNGFEMLKLISISLSKIVNVGNSILKSSFHRYFHNDELPTQDKRGLLFSWQLK
jgi:hypothetical protein